MDYRAAYKTLFNALTDAVTVLQDAQIATEKMYIEAEEDRAANAEPPRGN
ncbi:MAG: hypothetical protein LBH54_05325 [Clostridiales bacterium]|jgi:hypothetical protein|nr:hypothetical protein [Clostridiales bacterium]